MSKHSGLMADNGYPYPSETMLQNIFASSCVESVARKENVSAQEPAASYQQTISPEERKSVSLLAYSIKKAVNEVRSATSNHTHVGRLADDFLSELSQDEA